MMRRFGLVHGCIENANSVLRAALVGALACMLLGPEFSAGTPFWVKKDWTKWSSQDCGNMLYHSPWGQVGFLDLKGYRNEIDDMDGALFASALPVRLARVRREQIIKKYDHMTSAQQEQFDKVAQAKIADDASGSGVVVEIVSSRDEHGANSHFRPQETPQACLIGSVRSSEPQSVRNDNGVGYQVTFPRTVEGRPLLSPGDGKFTLQCGNNAFSFDTAQMTFRGKLEY